MSRSRVATLVLSTLTIAVAELAAQQPTTAKDVVSRHVAAAGGAGALEPPPQRHMVATVTMPGQVAGGLELESHYLAPGKVRIRTTIPPLGATEAGTDGTITWMAAPGMPPQLLEGARAEMVHAHRPRLPGWMTATSLELLGERQIDGERTTAIAWTGPAGRVVEHFDSRTGLWRASEQQDPRSGKLATTLYSEYATRDGYVLPMRTDLRMGTDTVATTRITTLDHAPIPPAIFTPPAGLPRPER